jgi:hypothetical protein
VTEPRKPSQVVRDRLSRVSNADLRAEIAYRIWQDQALYPDSQPPCNGFVPQHGFGNQRVCASCGKTLDEHPVRVQG